MKIEQIIANSLKIADVKKVIAGISGGADSVAMLLGLHEAGADITAIHCNFHLRGEESERDRRFVEKLCQRLEIPLVVIDFDVNDYMLRHKISTEMACRELRYAEFRRILNEKKADRIAVAHHADDNAETLLLNLMRGAGVAGMRGMVPDTGEIIRPLLEVSRTEILHYLESQGETYVTDSTNLISDYRRNFLRNEILPLLESRWPEARRSICRTAAIMIQEEKILGWAERQIIGVDSDTLPYSRIKGSPDRLWAIHRFITQFGGTASQAREIDRSLEADDFMSGKYWTVNSGRIVMERDRLEFINNHKDDAEHIKPEEKFRISRHQITKELLDKIKSCPLDELWTTLPPEQIIFRHPKNGDRIKPLGMNGSMLVSKIMKDAKLSTSQKEACLVAEDRETGEIIWVAGLKRSRLHLVNSDKSECFNVRQTCSADDGKG